MRYPFEILRSSVYLFSPSIHFVSTATFHKLTLTTDGRISVIGFVAATIHIIVLEPTTGVVVSKHQLSANIMGVDDIVILDGYLVWTNGDALSVHQLGTEKVLDTTLQVRWAVT